MSDKKPKKPSKPAPTPRPQPAGSHEVRGDTRGLHRGFVPERKKPGSR